MVPHLGVRERANPVYASAPPDLPGPELPVANVMLNGYSRGEYVVQGAEEGDAPVRRDLGFDETFPPGLAQVRQGLGT